MSALDKLWKSKHDTESGMTEKCDSGGPEESFVWCQFVDGSMFSGIVLYCKIAIIKMLVWWALANLGSVLPHFSSFNDR